MVDLIIDGVSQTLDGTHTYENVNITNGGILYVTPYDGTGTTGRLILNVIEVNIDSTSSIIGNARGYRGGAGSARPPGSVAFGGELSGFGGGSNGGPVSPSLVNRDGGGAGGGGYGTQGGSGGYSMHSNIGGDGGAMQGTNLGFDIQMGNGAGGGGASGDSSGSSGEAGGAMLTINATNINIFGTVNLNGGNGGNGGSSSGYGGGGGGASGGGILLNAINIDLSSATITANGGAGGYGAQAGNPGGGGRIKIFYSGAYNNSGATISAGTVYVYTPTPPTTFSTFPQGATIILDGVEQTPKTNTQIQLSPGLHNYILRFACYEDIVGQVNVTLDYPASVSGSFIKNTGDLSITSQPTGADVYFGINLQGQTPLSYTCYSEGTYGYYISLLGYQPFIGSVTTIRNILAEVNVTLIPVGPAGLGSIYVVSTPPGATIFLDDTNTGQVTPHSIINVPIGPHTIRLEKNGYNQWTSLPITVGDNQTSSVTANLTIADNICSWIESKGGWTAITSYDIMTLVNAYLGLVPIDFPVTMAYILGAISYYLDIVGSGNAYTGCQFQ